MFRQKAFMFGYSQERLFLAKELGYKLMGFSIIVNEKQAY
jgi:hypothetical protein